ncbi:transcriptional regulator with XRE-family HTH domain [Streptacidiphilus sp. MAP12-16]|uniref:helix-turn-helix domain-containing protein n=1 Tax=Streptacidiphilus sp. MAP12-16 TaxID=3156300 RepID=UPI0035115FCB
MRRRTSVPVAAPVPFDPAAACAARGVLGLSPVMVARAMASHGVYAVPPQVIAWETGELLPSEAQLVALARALWCPPGQLMGGRAVSIRDHRLALGLPPEELARQLGLTPRVYAQLEATPRWTGDEDETYLLAQALRLTPRALVAATGRGEELQVLLQRAIDGRWQPQAKALARLVPTLGREWIDHALRVLHDEGHTSGALWGGDSPDEAEPPPGPEELTERFWLLLDS